VGIDPDPGPAPDQHDIADYNSTFNLVVVLFEQVEGKRAQTHSGSAPTGEDSGQQKTFWRRFFGM
jgi:hypothetical protein